MRHGRVPGMKRVPRFLGCLLLVAIFAIGTTRQTTADAEAEALLAASATAMDEIQSYHFVISITTGELIILDRLELTRAEGDVEQPHTLKVSVSGKLRVFPVTANVIIIGEDVWVAVSPKEDKYTKLNFDRLAKMELTTALDLTRALLKATQQVDNPVIAGTEELNGVTTTVVEGTVDLRLIDRSKRTSDRALEPVSVRIWVDGASLVRRIQVVGQLLDSEPEGIVYQVDLSRFNEPVEIVAP